MSPWFAPLVLSVAALVAYSNSFSGPFVFDDVSSVTENATIRDLTRFDRVLSPPVAWGATVSGRPILNFSLAINYAISGLNVWSYHALNLLIHVLAGLTLFGLVRRTLTRAVFAADVREFALPLSLIVALLWTLHPLQTESVTYVVQRAESLMGLFFLFTLYAFARSVDSPAPLRWRVAAVASCLLGVGTKEVTALAPILVFLYDRTFVSGGFRAAWQRHRRFHVALALTWIPLGWLIAETGGNRGGTVGFDVGVSLLSYWATQFEAVTRYLWLALWPHPLVFEYGRVTTAGAWSILPWAVPVVVLALGTAVALRRWPVVGFLGAWFFGILAPTSVMPGTIQTIVEHRMYLPLAAVIAFVVVAGRTIVPGRSAAVVAVGVALALGVTTFQRNRVYATHRALWTDTLQKRPNNALAHNNFGAIEYADGNRDSAIEHYRTSLRLNPEDANAHYNLGIALADCSDCAGAIAEFREVIRRIPYFYNAHLNLGICLNKIGQPQEAIAHFAEALRWLPALSDAHVRWGIALGELGRWDDAIAHYARALALNPRAADAESNWGVALYHLNRFPEAITRFESALRLTPDLPEVHFNLGLALVAAGRLPDAIAHYAQAVRANPAHADAQLNLGIALGQSGQLEDALVHLHEAVRLQPNSFVAHTNLAIALMDAKQGDAALAEYVAAMRLSPTDPKAHYNVGYALTVAGRWEEAAAEFEAALRLRPDFEGARDMLRHLRENTSAR